MTTPTTTNNKPLQHDNLQTATERNPLLSQSSRRQQPPRRRSSIIDQFVFMDPPTEDEAIRRQEALLLQPGIGPAAFFIRDAVMGDHVENPAEGAYVPYFSFDDKNTRLNRLSIVCRRLCSHKTLLNGFTVACWALAGLSMVEPPPWCGHLATVNDTSCWELLHARGPSIDAPNTIVEYYPNTQSTILTLHQATLVQAFLVTYVLVFQLLRVGRDGCSWSRYLRPGPARWNRIVQGIATLLLLVDCGMPNNATRHEEAFLLIFPILAPYARLALVVSLNTANVQRDIWALIRMIPRVVPVLLLLLFMVLFYAWFGTVSFAGTRQGELHFPNIVDACWTLWICVTTANYPDVYMPAYNDNRWVALFFVSFMIVTYFFFMNLILAIVVERYEDSVAQHQLALEEQTADCLKQAFAVLDATGSGSIGYETVAAVFTVLNEDFPEFRELSEEDTALLFAILDKDGNSMISREEFYEFGNVLLLEFEKASAYTTWVERWYPEVYRSNRFQSFCAAIKSNEFELVVDLILVLNAVVVGIQSYPILSDSSTGVDPRLLDGSFDTFWEILEALFTIVYCIEIALKITVYGTKAYMEQLRNVFDLVITILATTSTAIIYYPGNNISNSHIVRMIVMARVLRLGRLLNASRTFQLLTQVQAQVLPAAASVVLALLYLMYAFAALGMHLYGGMVTRDGTNIYATRLLGTVYAGSECWPNNFNDMLSGLNVLFNLLVVNNWTQVESGFEAVTQSRWVRLYYLAFFVLGVVLVNNLVIAFIVSSFLNQMLDVVGQNSSSRTGVVLEHGQAILLGRKAVFDATEITGTKTSLTGRYIARVGSGRRGGHSTTTTHQERLRELFSSANSIAEDEKEEQNGNE